MVANAAAVAVAVAALALSGAGRTADTGPPDCQAAEFAIAPGFAVSPATGQHPLTTRLTNHGRNACVLFGYPAITFVDRRGAIPFAIRRGGDQMVTARRPIRVVVRPGRSAFVALNKYRCDRGDLRVARTLRLGFPRDASRRLSLRVPSPGPSIDYCGKGDVGSIIATSPFSPSLAAALRH